MKMASPALLESQASPPPTTEEALYEVVNGQRVELPPMSIYASWITSRLQNQLGPFTEVRQLGTVVMEALFILDPERDLRRRPDLAFVSVQRWPLDRLIPETGDWEVVPDLAVEVIGPNDLFQAVLDKMDEDFEKGVRQVWIIVPRKQQIFVFESPTRVRILTPAEELDGGDLLPGFRLPVACLFQRPTGGGAPAHV
jgi:Uma2 family endonuclease